MSKSYFIITLQYSSDTDYIVCEGCSVKEVKEHYYYKQEEEGMERPIKVSAKKVSKDVAEEKAYSGARVWASF